MVALAFGIQTKTSFLEYEYEKQVIFYMTRFEGGVSVSD
jgi:hypothetical protein